MTITLRCPTCSHTVTVRARHATVTCPHTNTIHDAKRASLMTVVAAEQEVA